jgi:hypothetical protein
MLMSLLVNLTFLCSVAMEELYALGKRVSSSVTTYIYIEILKVSAYLH